MANCDHISIRGYRFGREDYRGFVRVTCKECGKFLGYKPPEGYQSAPKKDNDDEKWQRERKTQGNIDWEEMNDV